jgi:hypothetical protein
MTDHMTHNVKALFLTESHSTNKNVPSSEWTEKKDFTKALRQVLPFPCLPLPSPLPFPLPNPPSRQAPQANLIFIYFKLKLPCIKSHLTTN